MSYLVSIVIAIFIWEALIQKHRKEVINHKIIPWWLNQKAKLKSIKEFLKGLVSK